MFDRRSAAKIIDGDVDIIRGCGALLGASRLRFRPNGDLQPMADRAFRGIHQLFSDCVDFGAR